MKLLKENIPIVPRRSLRGFQVARKFGGRNAHPVDPDFFGLPIAGNDRWDGLHGRGSIIVLPPPGGKGHRRRGQTMRRTVLGEVGMGGVHHPASPMHNNGPGRYSGLSRTSS